MAHERIFSVNLARRLEKLLTPALDEASPRTQWKRLQSFSSTTTETPDEQGVTPPKLLAYEIKSQYLYEKTTATVAKKFIQQEAKPSSKVSMSTSLAVLIAGKWLKEYIDTRLLLKNEDHDILPVYDKLNNYKKERRPLVKELQEPE